MNDFTKNFLNESSNIISNIDSVEINLLIAELYKLKLNKGRLFICGLGGSAGHASHAVNDFRKLCEINAVSPLDNLSELTARANDEGWHSIFSGFLANSNLSDSDALLIFSVGGGSISPNVSIPLIEACKFAQKINAKIFSILGRDGGIIKNLSHISIIVPNLFPERVTPHTEGITSILWHLIVSHPTLKVNLTKW